MKSKIFSKFLGVDQTGAARAGGMRAKPLPWALAELSVRDELRVELGSLGEFSEAPVRALVGPGEAAVLLDCVLGLPAGLPAAPRGARELWRLFERARAARGPRGELYGREVARGFFETLWSGPDSERPARLCERLARANSVFQLHPFQKNIQTGTFRLWRELGASPEPWARVWPFESPLETGAPAHPGGAARSSPELWIFEAYPSLLWRQVLGLSARDPSALRRVATQALERAGLSLRFSGWRELGRDPDLADAFVLAISGALLQRERLLWEPFPGFRLLSELQSEGWIAGLGQEFGSP